MKCSLPEDTLLHLSSHPRIHLNSHDLSALLQDPDGKVTRSRTDFKDDIGGFQIRLVYLSA